MDPTQMPQEEPGADEVIINLLTELVQQGRSRRAEGVMAPPAPEAVEAPPADEEMAELEAMLADPAAAEAPLEAPPKKPEDEDETE